MTVAGGIVFRSCCVFVSSLFCVWCVSGARAPKGCEGPRVSPVIPVVLGPPAQSAVPFLRGRFGQGIGELGTSPVYEN